MIETVREYTGEDPEVSIIIPIRNRYGRRLKNCLDSTKNKNIDIEIIIADYGSSSSKFDRVMKTVGDLDCSVYRYTDTTIPWSRAACINIGLRRSKAQLTGILDADCIVSKNTIRKTLDMHMVTPNAMLISKVHDLPEEITPWDITIPDSYDLLRKSGKLERPGFGAYMFWATPLWRKLRGMNEKFIVWGGEDNEMVKRVNMMHNPVAELSVHHMFPNIKVYHQWHNMKRGFDDMKISKTHYNEIRIRNSEMFKEQTSLIVNDENWGCA